MQKTLVATSGTWSMGIECADCLLMERNPRHNCKMSLNRRDNFPSIGHCNTWMVDQLQILMKHNHNICLFPNWPNHLDYVDTNESFGTIALRTETLQYLLNNNNLNCNEIKLTPEQKHIAKAMGTKTPFLPICTKEELKLFSKLCLENKMQIRGMAEKLIPHVIGFNMFPKLYVHLRTHFEKWNKNRRIKDAITKSKIGLETLQKLFEASKHFFNANDSPHLAGTGLNQRDETKISGTNCNVDSSANFGINNFTFQNPLPPSFRDLLNVGTNAIQLVRRHMIGLPNVSLLFKKGRGNDRWIDKKRVCSWYDNANNGHKDTCKGKGGLKFCKCKTNE